MRVKDIMSDQVVSVTLDDSLSTIRDIFSKAQFHHLMVVSEEEGRLMGIISDRDLLKHASPYLGTANELPRDAATLKKRAHQIMTRKPVTITADAGVPDAIALFVEENVSCLPVVDQQERLVGVLSWRTIMKALAVRIKQHD